MGILTILLGLLCFIIPFGVFERLQVIPSVFIYFHDLIIFPLFLFVLYKITVKKEITRPGILKGIVVFGLVGLISLLLNARDLNLVDFFVSLSYLIRFLMYSSLIFIFDYLNIKKIYNLLKTLNLSLLLFVFFGFLQYLFSPSLKQFYVYGWDEHFYRLTSTYLDPNFAGISILLYIILLFYFVMEAIKSKEKIAYPIITSFLSILALFLTYSRSAIVAFVFSAPALIIVERRKRLLVLALAIVIFAGILTPKNFNLVGLNPFRVFSSVERLKSIENAYKVFTTSPIYGVGFNSYRYAQKRIGFLDSQWEKTHAGAGASNSYVFLLATTGIAGFLAFIYFIWEVVRYLIYDSKKTSYSLSKGVALASFTAVLVHSLFDNTFFYSFTMIILFYILGIMGYKVAKGYRKR